MLLSVIIFGSVLSAASPDIPPQDAPAAAFPAQSLTQNPDATELDEVVVEGQRTREAAEAFVRSVAAPVRGRKAAAWRDSVCVGVIGMRPDAARFMADRISDWAHSLGLSIKRPGCRPQILIVATNDGDETARQLVAERPRDFRLGVAESDRGGAALEDFQTSGRPIRWWHVSLPVNDDTGLPIKRLPGQPTFSVSSSWGIRSPVDLGAYGMLAQPSRLADHTRDDLVQAIIILDTAALDQADFSQITDYVAMVALAQVDPDVNAPHPSILRLFDPSQPQEDSLTRWDRAYLSALYRTDQGRSGSGSNMSLIAATLIRDLEQYAPDDELPAATADPRQR